MKKKSGTQGLLTIKEVATYFKVKPATIRRARRYFHAFPPPVDLGCKEPQWTFKSIQAFEKMKVRRLLQIDDKEWKQMTKETRRNPLQWTSDIQLPRRGKKLRRRKRL